MNRIARSILAAAVLGALAAGASAACPPLLDQQLKTLEGKPLDLCQFEGKAILVVNTASKCGYTPQFDQLEGMYKQYKERGLVVLGFPSNDFRQELASNKEVGDFCRMTYGVRFPMAEKSSVIGDAANPFFKRLAEATMDPPTWNFHKYLIAPDGKTVFSFPSGMAPDSAPVMTKLQTMLKP
ncbi:MAG: glutathione peroxidase [Betaproteobacteria bacterium]